MLSRSIPSPKNCECLNCLNSQQRIPGKHIGKSGANYEAAEPASGREKSVSYHENAAKQFHERVFNQVYRIGDRAW